MATAVVYGLYTVGVLPRVHRLYLWNIRHKVEVRQFRFPQDFTIQGGRSGGMILEFANPLYFDTDTEELKIVALGHPIKPNELIVIRSATYLRELKVTGSQPHFWPEWKKDFNVDEDLSPRRF